MFELHRAALRFKNYNPYLLVFVSCFNFTRGDILKVIVVALVMLVGVLNPLAMAHSECFSFLNSSYVVDNKSYKSEENSPLIDQEALYNIERFLQTESDVSIKMKHASQVRLQVNSGGAPVFTKHVALLIHGLFLSPRQMELQADEAFKQGYNVISLRLKGHNEKQPDALDSVTAEDWLQQVFDVYDLAEQLGQKITLMGHSTGGLLALNLALEKPKNIDKVILISPAIRVTQINKFKSYFIATLGLSSKTLQKIFLKSSRRPQSGIAGWQVVRLSEMLNLSERKVLKRLSRKTFTVINLERDEMIESSAVRKFYDKLYRKRQPEGASYVEVSRKSGLTHADLNFNYKNPTYKKVIEPAIAKALEF